MLATLLCTACGGGSAALLDEAKTALEHEKERLERCSETCQPTNHLAPSKTILDTPLTPQLVATFPHPAVDPQPRSELDWWTYHHERINAEVQENQDAQLLFIGDSITWGWSLFGSKLWDEYYLPRKALNLGIIGDQTQHVLWRLRNGNLDGLDPRAVVLLIGVNNAFDPAHQPQHIAAGVAMILDELKRRLPRAKVLLLGLLPANDRPCLFRHKLAATNALLARFADERVTFLDFGEALLDENGMLSAEVAFDYLHLTEKGYKIWTIATEATLRGMLDERPGGPYW